MSKSRRSARGKAATRRRLPVPWPILVLLILAVAAVGYASVAPDAHAVEHPDPRPGITAAKVQPPERYADDPLVAQVYAEVAEIAAVVDGIYCYCHCSQHAGHYSLLSCFEDDHGAGCGTCLQQAHMAYLMTQEGASLDEIRDVVDQRFGG